MEMNYKEELYSCACFLNTHNSIYLGHFDFYPQQTLWIEVLLKRNHHCSVTSVVEYISASQFEWYMLSNIKILLSKILPHEERSYNASYKKLNIQDIGQT
jgi:hypothetical protein